MRCSPPARTGFTSTSWTITTCRISPSARGLRGLAQGRSGGAHRCASDGFAGRCAGRRTSPRRARPASASIPRRRSTWTARFSTSATSGCTPGLVFNPATSLELAGLRDRQDRRHLIDVGQSRDSAARNSFPRLLAKLAEARARIEAAGRDIRLEIDGGVKVENAAEIAKAGADTFVAGSAIFGSADYARHHPGDARGNRDRRRK